MKHPLAAFVPYAVISVLHLVFMLTGNQTLTDIAATARMPLLALAVVIVLQGASRSLAGVLLLIAIASTRVNALVTWGGAFFLASDTFLSLVIFMPDAVAGWGFFLAMLTYNGGQGLLALGAVLAMRARR